MQCVALFKEKNFNRAKVLSLKGNGLLEIHFVDYGVTEVVKEENVRKIVSKFRDYPVGAVQVKLAEIRPAKGYEWDEQAKQLLSERIDQKQLVMSVNGEGSDGSSMEVLLYEVKNKTMVNIGAWLVEQGTAISTEGAIQTPTSKVTQHQWEDECQDNVASYVERKSKSPNNASDGRFSVRILNADEATPDSLYLIHLNDEEAFHRLKEELNNYYKHSSVEDSLKVNKDEYLAVFKDSEWKRAKVTDAKRFLGKLNVKLLDDGGFSQVEPKNVRLLEDKFRYRNFVHRVALPNIVPAGGSSWTKRSLEVFRGDLMKTCGIVEAQIKGKEGWRKITPMLIFVENSDLKEKLISCGLALPVKSNLDPDTHPRSESHDTLNGEHETEEGDENDAETFSWIEKPPELEEIFEALATWVDWEGQIHLIPACRLQTLAMIEKRLKDKFQDSLPRPPDRYWRKGDAAIAR